MSAVRSAEIKSVARVDRRAEISRRKTAAEHGIHAERKRTPSFLRELLERSLRKRERKLLKICNFTQFPSAFPVVLRVPAKRANLSCDRRRVWL